MRLSPLSEHFGFRASLEKRGSGFRIAARFITDSFFANRSFATGYLTVSPLPRYS